MRLKVEINGRMVTTEREAYVKAKTKQLREFGYSDLSKEHVSEQVDAVLSGTSLSVIGMFMKEEIKGKADD